MFGHVIVADQGKRTAAAGVVARGAMRIKNGGKIFVESDGLSGYGLRPNKKNEASEILQLDLTIIQSRFDSRGQFIFAVSCTDKQFLACSGA